MDYIKAAVEPQKQESVNRMVARAAEYAAKQKEKLAAVGFDLQQLAPYPRATIGRRAYQEALSYRNFLETLTRPTQPVRSPLEPNIRTWDEAKVAKYLDDVAKLAGQQFDAYVAKLTAKVGDVDDAEVTGYVWNGSILRVTKPDGSIERWSTKQIINVSCLGLLFNQWPTRKLKS